MSESMNGPTFSTRKSSMAASGNMLSQSLPDRRAGSPTSQTIVEQLGFMAIIRIVLILTSLEIQLGPCVCTAGVPPCHGSQMPTNQPKWLPSLIKAPSDQEKGID